MANMASFKKQMKRDTDLMKRVIEEEMKQCYEIVHEGHEIVVQHSLENTWLYIDDVLVDEVHCPAAHKLKATETLKGSTDQREIKVKIHRASTLDCTFYIDGKKILKEKREIRIQPWRHHTPLVSFIEKNGVEAPLPDMQDDTFITLDDIWPEEVTDEARQVAQKLVKKTDWLLEKPVEKTRQSIYEQVLALQFVDYAKAFRDELNAVELDEQKLYEEAQWFIEHAAHRQVLVFGLLLLGRAHAIEKERGLWLLIGGHPVFAPFVALALEDRGEEAMKLAYEFVRSPQEAFYLRAMTPINDDMRHYYLMHAPIRYDDVVSAVDFAKKGELYKALHTDVIDEALFDRATAFLLPMLAHGDIAEQYGDFAQMTLDYVKHAKMRAVVYEKLYPIARLHLYMKEEADYALEKEYISIVTRNLVLSGTEAILKSSNWRPLIEKAFSEQRDMEYALTIARAVGEDYVQLAYKKVVNGYFEPYLYDAIAMSGNKEVIAKTADYVAQFELTTLNPLELESVVILIRALDQYSGIGAALIAKALNGQYKEMIEAALLTLEDWAVQHYRKKEFLMPLQYIATTEKSRHLRKMAKALLKTTKDG